MLEISKDIKAVSRSRWTSTSSRDSTTQQNFTTQTNLVPVPLELQDEIFGPPEDVEKNRNLEGGDRRRGSARIN